MVVIVVVLPLTLKSRSPWSRKGGGALRRFFKKPIESQNSAGKHDAFHTKKIPETKKAHKTEIILQVELT